MQIHRYPVTLLEVPADLRADPDGDWSYETLVAATGLDPDASPPPLVAALCASWRGHPEGAAVVAAPGEGWLAIIDCVGASAVQPTVDPAAPRVVGAPAADRVSRAA